MISPEPEAQPHSAPKPVGVLLFGLFSIILGAALAFSALALAALTNLTSESPLWLLVVLIGIGYVVCGIGSLEARPWGWKISVLVYGVSFIVSIVQAFLRVFVWGILFEPIILSYLLIPQVRAYFIQFSASSPATTETETGRPGALSSVSGPVRAGSQIRRRKTTILTALAIIAILSIVPIITLFEHAVLVKEVTLDIAYAGNPAFPWFGFSPKSVSGQMFTWGNGRLAFSFSLTNLGLFQTHSIDSISLETSGFVLYPPSTPISVPDLAPVTLSMQLQTPDYNYFGPVTIQINTS